MVKLSISATHTTHFDQSTMRRHSSVTVVGKSGSGHAINAAHATMTYTSNAHLLPPIHHSVMHFIQNAYFSSCPVPPVPLSLNTFLFCLPVLLCLQMVHNIKQDCNFLRTFFYFFQRKKNSGTEYYYHQCQFN